MIHAAAEAFRRIKQVRAKPRRAKRPRKRDGIVNRPGHCRMASHRPVSLRPHREQLPTRRRETRIGSRAHPLQRQKPEQHEMNQRDNQPLQPRHCHLPRHAARERDACFVHELRDLCQRIRRADSHVGVGENEQLALRGFRQLLTGKILSHPAPREFRAPHQPHAWIARADSLDDRRRPVRRVIVEDYHFQIDAARCQRRPHDGCDVGLLIPRGNQERNPRRSSPPDRGQRTVSAEVREKKPARDQRENEPADGKRDKHHPRLAEPWPARNSSPRNPARNFRHRS
jgi:hypothetical protein